jgi:peptidoglycan/xylan/chitin deacetylase (PgdA/CDA1 family)
MYHSVAPARPAGDPFRITVTPERFERQLGWLRRRGLRGVSVRELLAAEDRRALVGLTFDDGYADFPRYALPVLLRWGFTATVYVVAGRLGGSNDWEKTGPVKVLMGQSAVLECIEAGMEIGSHGLMHRRLTELDAETAAHEITESRLLLGDLTGTEITGYCYAYGDHGAREVELVRAAGYDYACAVEPSPWLRQYALPRTYIGQPDAGLRMTAKRVRAVLAARRRASFEFAPASVGQWR